MVSKKYKWQTQWSRNACGQFLHTSGLVINITSGDGYTDLIVDDASLVIFESRESSRGVPHHDIAARLKRLTKEAQILYEGQE